MVLVSIYDLIRPDTMSRKKYSDIGIYPGAWSDKLALYNTSGNIVKSLLQYSNEMKNRNINIEISVGVDYTKLIYVDVVFIRYIDGGTKFDFMVNLKGSYNYKILERYIFSGKSIPKAYLLLYERFWKDAYKAMAVSSDWSDILSQVVPW